MFLRKCVRYALFCVSRWLCNASIYMYLRAAVIVNRGRVLMLLKHDIPVIVFNIRGSPAVLHIKLVLCKSPLHVEIINLLCLTH